MATVSLVPSSQSLAISDDTSIGSLVPIISRPSHELIPFSVMLVTSGGAPGAGSAHFVDVLTPPSTLNPFKTNFRSLRIHSAKLIISCSQGVTQNVGASIVGCMVPNLGPALAPANAVACVAFHAQSFQVNLTNAGNTFASTYEYPLRFNTNGITDQLMPTGNIGNQFPPAFRFFITTSGPLTGLGANELGVCVLLQGLIDPSGAF